MTEKEPLEDIMNRIPEVPVTKRIIAVNIPMELTGVEFLLLAMQVMGDSPVGMLTAILLGPKALEEAKKTLSVKMRAGFNVLRTAIPNPNGDVEE